MHNRLNVEFDLCMPRQCHILSPCHRKLMENFHDARGKR